MKIIFFIHPSFLESQSMPRFAKMLIKGMGERKHAVEMWTAKPIFYKLPVPHFLKKWMGYFDQYLFFPLSIKRRLQKEPVDTLFVFTDQALGPWIPFVKDRPHVIHCHDFLAQKSALGEIPQNPTSWTGQQYQTYIRKGYQAGKNFISVSQKTQDDLHRFLGHKPLLSVVVYNGMNKNQISFALNDARQQLSELLKIDLSKGYFLHVGGNQWYKNRTGVVMLYNAWREKYKLSIPLLLIGSQPSEALQKVKQESDFADDIYFLTGKGDDFVQMAYAGASLFLFPSFAEGFGWPIAEAMAAGCPVVTTGEAPMTEVGSNIAFYIKKQPDDSRFLKTWLEESADSIQKVIQLSEEEKKVLFQIGQQEVEKKFSTKKSLDLIESVYLKILKDFKLTFESPDVLLKDQLL